MPNESFVEILLKEFKKRDNPVDLKSSIIGKVVQVNPVIVQIEDGKILLTEGEELEISEWFRFRCNIDSASRCNRTAVTPTGSTTNSEGVLSSSVPKNLENAKNVSETHSEGGAPCNIPNAISFLAEAINAINTELLALKCNLQKGDYVTVASLDETDKYILIDKVLSAKPEEDKEE